MTISRDDLKNLHELHQRAKALRERLISGPKTNAARQAIQAKRQAELDAARKGLQTEKLNLSKREHQLKGQQSKTDDLRVKLNSIRKNDEYATIMKLLQAEGQAIVQTEEAILQSMVEVERQAAALLIKEEEVSKSANTAAAQIAEISEQLAKIKGQLDELDVEITLAEEVIPEAERDNFRRMVKQRGSDAMAPVENSSCTGCYVSVTSQMVNELINGRTLVYCKSCGRLLYLPEAPASATRRKGRVESG